MTQKKKKKITRDKREKINIIYDTFFDLIITNGYDKISTNHVAKTAQISIGTIYRYFPNGKSDIIAKYFENSKQIVFDIEDFMKIGDNNLYEVFERFIAKFLKNFQNTLGYRLAFRNAILSDKALLEAHRTRIFIFCKEIAENLRTSSNLFKPIPEDRIIKRFVFIYNIIEANIHHHLLVMKMFENDDELIKYLSNLAIFSLEYLGR